MSENDIQEAVRGRVSGAIKQFDRNDVLSETDVERITDELSADIAEYVEDNLSAERREELLSDDDGE